MRNEPGTRWFTSVLYIVTVVLIALCVNTVHVRRHHLDMNTPARCFEYSDASVQRRLCLEEEGVVLYTQGRGADTPIRQVLNAPAIQ